MNRRGFLGTMMALIGSTAIDPKSLLWTPDFRAVEILEPSALVTLDQITFALLRELKALRSDTVLLDIAPMHVGQVNASGMTMNNHYGIDMMTAPNVVDRCGLDCAHFIKPMARKLHDRIGKIRACGVLPLPGAVARASNAWDVESGLSVRGIMDQYFDIRTGDVQNILRFDMLVSQ